MANIDETMRDADLSPHVQMMRRFWPCGGHGLPNRRALIATITVLTDISTAPKAGVSTIPQGAATPAASGIANAL